MDGCLYNYCHQLSEGVFPTPIYETFFGIIIFIILWSLRKRITIPGILFFIYVFLNGIERFFIEKIRTNPDINLLGMKATQAEYVAALLIIIGLAGIVYLYLKRPKA